MLEIKNALPWEKTIMIIRVHWITYLILSLQIIAIIIFSITLLEVFKAKPIVFLSITITWLISSIFLYIEWLNYELDRLIITNNRIIWINQISFLNRAVSEANLAQVQEVNSKTKWFFSNIFNYGDISIQTAWSKVGLSMTFCPNAIYEARKILNFVEEYKASHKVNI
jgi:ABC-type sugar transport system permease subunit